MNENILKTASSSSLSFEYPSGSGEYIQINYGEEILHKEKLQTALTSLENTWSQIFGWNKEFIESYFPGSSKANAIAPLIKQMPLEREFSEIKDDSERYKEWIKRLVDGKHLLLKFPGIGGGEVVFKWDTNPIDPHGRKYRGAVSWDHHGTPHMSIDPIYWFNSDETDRRDLLLHEFEHVIDLWIGSTSPDYELDAGTRTATPVPGEWGDFGSEKQKQQRHYLATFSKSNWPDWLERYHILNIKPFSNIDWAGDKSQQRAELKKFLGYKNSEMTKEILAELNREKRSFDYTKFSSGLQQKGWVDYVNAFERRVGIAAAVLMYMKTDDESVIDNINQIALANEPTQSDPTEERSAYASRLDSLHNWLAKSGHSKEAALVKKLLSK